MKGGPACSRGRRRPRRAEQSVRPIELATAHGRIHRGPDGGKRPGLRTVDEPAHHRLHPIRHERPHDRGQATPQAGPGHSRMRRHRDGRRARRVQTPLQFEGEHQHREFRRRIRQPPARGAVGGRRDHARTVRLAGREGGDTGQVDGADPADVMREAAHHDDARVRGGEQTVEQQAGQGEMPEVVDAQRRVKTVLGGGRIRPHHPGIVDQQVNPGMLRPDPPGRRVHRPERGQVQVLHPHIGGGRAAGRGDLRADVGGGRLSQGHITTGQNDGGAVPGENSRGLETEAGVGAGDHNTPSAQVGYVCGTPAQNIAVTTAHVPASPSRAPAAPPRSAPPPLRPATRSVRARAG
ncbi:putative Endonuclease IV [Frankia sp. AiPs1]